jgi:hypothetical protein
VEVERHLLAPAKRNSALRPHAGDAAGRERDLAEITGGAWLRCRPAPDPSPRRMLAPEFRCGEGSCGGQ